MSSKIPAISLADNKMDVVVWGTKTRISKQGRRITWVSKKASRHYSMERI